MRLLIIILLLCSFSCKKANKLKQIKNKNSIINRIWLVEKQVEIDSLETEVYIFPNGDSIQNQYKKFKNGILDTLNSNFYKFGKLKFDDTIRKVDLDFYSCYDTLKKFNSRKIELTIFHKNKDSSYSKTYSPISGYNHFKFNYIDFDDENICGVIWESIQIDTIIKGENKMRLLEQIMLVDNKSPNSNPFDLISWLEE